MVHGEVVARSAHYALASLLAHLIPQHLPPLRVVKLPVRPVRTIPWRPRLRRIGNAESLVLGAVSRLIGKQSASRCPAHLHFRQIALLLRFSAPWP